MASKFPVFIIYDCLKKMQKNNLAHKNSFEPCMTNNKKLGKVCLKVCDLH